MVSAEKEALRREALLRRSQLAAAAPAAGERLVHFAPALLAALRERDLAPEIAGYVPIRDEIDVCPLLAALEKDGARLSLPAVTKPGAALIFRRWPAGGLLARGAHGTFEPLPEAPAVAPSLFLVPCLAFDCTGARLGYGGGFYDRTLAEAAAAREILAIACAYAGQEVARLPGAAHDHPLHGILTEAGFIATGAGFARHFTEG